MIIISIFTKRALLITEKLNLQHPPSHGCGLLLLVSPSDVEHQRINYDAKAKNYNQEPFFFLPFDMNNLLTS